MVNSTRYINIFTGLINLRGILLLPFLVAYSFNDLNAQALIKGRIDIDTTLWTPIAYLSIIPDFTQMYMTSNESIIQRSNIDKKGYFSFDGKELRSEDHLYRIHFSKKGDPAASLIIGGREENHLFLIANNRSKVDILIRGGQNLITQITFGGYALNMALQEINNIAGFLDTLDYYGPAVNRDFVRQAVYDKLRQYADTCSNSLISLYALYHSRFESDYFKNPAYYNKYLRKWKNEDTGYFREFRASLSINEPPKILLPIFLLIIFVLIAIGIIVFLRSRKKTSKSPYQSLTVQERRIFSLLKEGKSNKEISDICGVSLNTIKTHVNNIYLKLNLNSRTDVIDFRE